MFLVYFSNFLRFFHSYLGYRQSQNTCFDSVVHSLLDCTKKDCVNIHRIS